jgi:glycogen debranching enzyme
MKVTHIFNEKIEKEVDGASFLLANKLGGYAWFDPVGVKSKYQGVFFIENNKMFRVIESIKNSYPAQIINRFFQVEKITEKGKETFFMPDFSHSLVYESEAEAEICLDFKEAYKNNYAEYEVKKEKNKLIIKMIYEGEVYHLVIRSSAKIEIKKQYLDRNYEYDRNRKSFPCDRRVFLLCRIGAGKTVFSFYSNKKSASLEAQNIFFESEKLKEKKAKRISNLTKNLKISPEASLAYNSCLIQLDNLSTNKEMLAGFPWFFQFWSRDELISLKALEEINPDLAEKILEKWLSTLDEKIKSKENLDGSFEGCSIDAVGWLFKRMENSKLIKSEKVKNFFSKLDEKMLYNGKNETWMDSLPREGYRIEMQAMKLFILNLANKATGDVKYRINETILKKEVREKFLDSELYDSVFEKEIRPNIFIAYYFYPELLEKKEWEECFSRALEKLWCDWGGLSTIDKTSQNFHRRYTGEDGKSYHQGDSWFWINNLAALSLLDVNKEKFSHYIEKILEASTFEILFLGAIANHSELSSASVLEPAGCVCQAFSAAMYLELINRFLENSK